MCCRAALVVALLSTAQVLTIRAAIPLPRATGPVAVTATSYPFGGAAHTRVPTDLAAAGYVEEEFFVSGTANVYDWHRPGPAVVRTPNVPYTTRVLVRRPRARARFSGTVIVELLNPSNLFDLNIGWALSHQQIVRGGDAWVGITAKPVAIRSLRAFDPARYQPLAWPNPLPLDDKRNCTTVPRDSERTTENGLVWDIHRQVGAWLKSADKSNPLVFGASRPWLRKGVAPPRAAPIEVADGTPVLDSHGNVKGGVRSPYVDVPTSTWYANATGESFCRIAGYEVPFAAERLTALYPAKAAYVTAVEASVADLVKQRFVTKEDGRELVEQAKRRPW